VNILHLNFYDTEGGAARAAYRLHSGLQERGLESRMLVLRKSSDDPSVTRLPGGLGGLFAHSLSLLDHLPLRLHPARQRTPWGVGWFPHGLAGQVRRLQPDVVHLHWVSAGFMPIRALAKFRHPIVWTLHDMWPFTGGCHYAGDCTRYQESCGACPMLGSSTERDVSRWMWRKKRKHWAGLDLTIVTPSRWLADCARASSILRDTRVEVIPNGLRLDRYRPVEQRLARELLGLPTDRKLVLYGAVRATSDARKGFTHLQAALQHLAADRQADGVEAIVFGASTPANPPDLGLRTRYVGHLHDDVSLALLYAAADVFVAPSLQDNLPNTIVEALACGVPCVAFDVGGMPDLIDHRRTGYLARPFDSADLAAGIAWVTQHGGWEELSRQAREKAEKAYGLERMARRYSELYQELVTPEVSNV